MTEPENQLSVIPPPLEGDDDDVAWALQTASVQWKRGARADAIVWLRRAVDSATELGQLDRAQQINQTIVEVEELIVQTVFGRPPTEPPAAGSAEIDALIGLPPATGRASIDVELDDQIAFDDREESTTVMEQPELPAEPPPAGAFPPPWEHHAAPPPPPPPPPLPPPPVPLPAFPPSEPPPAEKFPPSAPPEPIAKEEKKVRRVRPPPPPSAMPKAPSVAPEAAIPPPPPQLFAQAPLPDLRESRSDLEPTIRAKQPPSSAPPAPLPPISYSVLGPPSVHEAPPEPPEQAAVTLPLASPEPLPARPEPAEPEPSDDEPAIKGVKLADVPGLQDLPPEAQVELVRSARLETLDVDEEVSSFGIALVIEGWASVMPAIADAACAFAQPGAVVFTQGSLETSVALRIVAGETDTVVAVWERDALEKATADCPWVADELRAVADRFQALAGAAMGPLGDRLDDTLRQSVTDRCEVRTYAAGDFVVEEAEMVPGLFVVGAGEVELLGPDGLSVTTTLGPGEFLFASEVMGGAPASATVRAGESGAVMLFLSRHTAHELMVSVPPLLEILAG